MTEERYSVRAGLMGESLKDASLQLAADLQEKYLDMRLHLLEERRDGGIVMFWLLTEREMEELVAALGGTDNSRLRVLAEQWSAALVSRDKYLEENPG
jgi:hypothetical protein